MMSLAKSLTAFWAARAARERQFLAAGAAALVALALYGLLIAPAAGGIEELKRRIPLARERDRQLEALIAEAKTLRALPQTATVNASDARASLEKSLQTAGLKVAHTDPLPNGDLRLTFVDVPYGKWTAWLAASERTMGVHTVAAHVKAAARGPGPAGAAASAGATDVELTLHLLRTG